MTDHSDSLEGALDVTGAALDDALRTATALVREIKKAKAAAATGQVRELTRGLAAVNDQSRRAHDEAQRAAASYDLDDTDHLASGAYTKELLSQAAQLGVAMMEEDGQLLCYPSLIRVFPGDAALEIDRRRERRLRPSVVIDLLGKAQQRPPRFKPAPFLETLLSAYDLVVARDAKKPDAVVRLDAIWSVLTLLPGQSRDYTKPEFARDLYLLDQTGETMSRSGRVLRWHASTGTRGAGVLTTVAVSGQQQRYWGASFTTAGNE